MYFLLDISPKYTELAITSTILCIKFNVFLCCFENPPPIQKKIPKSQIFAPNFQVLLKSYFCRTNLINIQVHINTYSNKTSHSNDQCSSQNIKCLPLVLLSVECNEEYKSGMLYSYYFLASQALELVLSCTLFQFCRQYFILLLYHKKQAIIMSTASESTSPSPKDKKYYPDKDAPSSCLIAYE